MADLLPAFVVVLLERAAIRNTAAGRVPALRSQLLSARWYNPPKIVFHIFYWPS